MSLKRYSVRTQSSGKEVTKDPASLQKDIDTRIVDSDANRSHRCMELSSVDKQQSRGELSRREEKTDVKPCGNPVGADH